jgi:hypothetical protein
VDRGPGTLPLDLPVFKITLIVCNASIMKRISGKSSCWNCRMTGIRALIARV